MKEYCDTITGEIWPENVCYEFEGEMYSPGENVAVPNFIGGQTLLFL